MRFHVSPVTKVSTVPDEMGVATVSGRSCLRGLDFGVEVKMGNLWGRRSGDMELSLEIGEFGGEGLIGRREEARGGCCAVRYILGAGFGGEECGDAELQLFSFIVGVGVGGLADSRLGAGFLGVTG